MTRVFASYNVSTRGGTMMKFVVRSAGDLPPHIISSLYNSMLDQRHEAGLAVTPEHIAARLYRDPEGVHLGFVDDVPVSLINVVKRKLASPLEMPTTHQALTSHDTFADTDPDHGNIWFCPWVVVSSEIRERCGDLRAAIDQVPRSLGQLHALTVKMEALRHGKVDHLFAYSRPGALRSFVQKEWSSSISFNFVLEDGRVQMRLADEGLAIAADRVGLRFEGTVDHFLTILDYWNMTDAKGRKVDPVFNFHAVNGAQFRPDLVMPFGQVFDQNSLFYRTPLEYLLRT